MKKSVLDKKIDYNRYTFIRWKFFFGIAIFFLNKETQYWHTLNENKISFCKRNCK